MTKQQARSRVAKLKALIDKHRYLYHVLDAPEISESLLDSLKKELFDLESQYPDLITSDSPTQRVAGQAAKQFHKVSRAVPMLSLQDAFSEGDMRAWEERFKKLLTTGEQKTVDYFCELKFDGLAVELTYQDGFLILGSTRGNGLVGEDVTSNLKTIEAIPLKIRGKDQVVRHLAGQEKEILEIALAQKWNQLKVRGEVLLSKKEFSKINQAQIKDGLPAYANPRNVAAGSIRQLDPKITSQRHLDFYAWDLVTDLGLKTHQAKHLLLKTLGFKTHPSSQVRSTIAEVVAQRDAYLKKREGLPFEIDGIVVQVNQITLLQKLGVAGKSPRGAIAFKFPLKEAQTIIEDIVVQVGRTGAITPLAVLRPVAIGGVTVSRATLHNEDEIKRLDVRIGDTVAVGRAGDVIPDIIKVIKEMRTGREREFKMPSNCPVCQHTLARQESDVIWRCPNKKCRARQRRYFYYFVGRGAFNIEGLGPKIIDQLLEYGLINDPADLFKIKETDLLNMERFAEKSAANLIKAIAAKKNIIWPKFIYSLGIPGVGEEAALDLAIRFKDLAALKKADFERLVAIEDIGPRTADSIINFFSDPDNLVFLDKLVKVGVNIRPYHAPSVASVIAGKVFVLTGSLESMSRDEAKAMIRARGCKVSESVSVKTDYVVAGEAPGAKLDQANKLGVPVITEKELRQMLE